MKQVGENLYFMKSGIWIQFRQVRYLPKVWVTENMVKFGWLFWTIAYRYRELGN